MKRVAFLIFILLFSVPHPLLAVDVAPRISDREIVERLSRLEEGQKQFQAQMDRRFDALQTQMDQRFDALQIQMDHRFGAMDKRFQGMEAQFDRLVNVMIAIVAAFAAVTASTIGFAVWDRRTMIRPFETKVKAIEEAFAENRQQVHALLESMRALGQRDEHVAELLRKFHLI